MLNERIRTAEAEVGGFGIERFDAAEIEADTIIQAVQSLPFLVPKKLVVVRGIESNKTLMERIPELVDRVADNVDVVIVEPALDRRKSGFKQLQKLTDFKDFKELKEQELPAWASEYARHRGAALNRKDAVFLIDRIGTNQQLLAREIDKLILYDADISKRTIELLTDQSVQSTIFSILDAAFYGDSKKAVELYREQRQAQLEPQYVVAMLTWQLQALALAVHADPKTEATLTAAGLSPFTARKSLELARKIDKSTLRNMVVNLSELDAQMKTSVDPDAGLETYLFSL